jgi:ElaB/YqjD/DUF883 family membrane-anchored ribosome-binding protein
MTAQHRPSEQGQKIAEKAEGVGDRASEALRNAGDTARDITGRAIEQAEKVPGAMRGTIDTSLQQQPLLTLATAAALGFVLGALWKS